MKLKNVENRLEAVKRLNPEMKNIFFDTSDERIGRKIALAVQNNYKTGISVLSDYYTYKEMYAFLMGYMVKSEERIKNFLNL